MTATRLGITISDLRAAFRGELIAPDDAGYDEARSVFLPTVDRRPALIVRPVDTGEAARVVSLAREHGLELAVRSGGHSGAGHGVSEGGIVLDLSLMKALDVDPERRTAWGGDRPHVGRGHARDTASRSASATPAPSGSEG